MHVHEAPGRSDDAPAWQPRYIRIAARFMTWISMPAGFRGRFRATHRPRPGRVPRFSSARRSGQFRARVQASGTGALSKRARLQRISRFGTGESSPTMDRWPWPSKPR